MNRRETLKALFLASASTGIIATTGCSTSVIQTLEESE